MQICYNAIYNGFWNGFDKKIEPRYDKTNKMIYAPSEDSDQHGHPPSLIRLRCRPEAKLGLKLPIERTVKTLIRLGGCPGWSESSLGTKVILLVSSWGGSKCFFLESKYSAHFFFTFRIEPNTNLFIHANNIVLRQNIYIHSFSWC